MKVIFTTICVETLKISIDKVCLFTMFSLLEYLLFSPENESNLNFDWNFSLTLLYISWFVVSRWLRKSLSQLLRIPFFLHGLYIRASSIWISCSKLNLARLCLVFEAKHTESETFKVSASNAPFLCEGLNLWLTNDSVDH